ncbi:glutamate receptor ionotropic, delta-2-like [Penaeus indicus]|uniref:glutamate receptor ionotropic, delta-2-like n=1 Tax=Penaeus indicus TaxID=29960 RepID=UPI00300D71F2
MVELLYWIKTKIQDFGDLLEEPVQPIHIAKFATAAVNIATRMKVLTLKEALANPEILKELEQNPGTFKFPEPVDLVVTSRTGKYATVLQDPASPGGLRVEGPLGNLLEYMASSMNFSYTLIMPPDRGIGSQLPNGTWTGIVGQVSEKVADIGLESMKMIPKRIEVVDFGDILSYVYMKILAGKGHPKLNPMGFLYPLSPLVWAGLFGALLCVWAATVVLGSRPQGSRREAWAAALFYIYFGVVVQQAMAMKFIRGAEKLLIGSWMLVAMVMAWSYSCNLVSLLAARQVPQPIQSLRDVIDSDVKVITSRFTAFTHMLDHVESGIFKELSDLRLKNRWVYSKYGEADKPMELTRQGDHVQLTLDISAKQSVSDYFTKTGLCDFYLPRETFLPGPTSIVLQKGTPILQAVNHRIRRVVYAGLFDYWVSQSTVNASVCEKTPSTITVMEPLSFTAVSGMLAMWACGMALSLITFCVELALAKVTQ